MVHMGKGLLNFESKRERYIFLGIIGVLFLIGASMFYPGGKVLINNKIVGVKVNNEKEKMGLESLELSKTPKEYYKMFQCSCCGQPIDKGCCGMAKQRKDYLDKLLLDGPGEMEVVYEMVKKFGFDILMDSSMEDEVKEYIRSQADENPPELTLDRTKHDFGTIKQSKEIISTEFTIKNTGKADLIIENMDTSCMCTEARLIYKGVEGPIFGMSMHGKNPENFELKIPPGDSAILKVYYDPMAHGKQKRPEMKITREVTIISNDPVNFQQKVRIELNQVL